MSDPLTTCISEIELLQERIAEKNDRIEALEAALMAEWAARDNRIEALEAALRSIEDVCRDEDHEAALIAVAAIARAALE
jgi:hypothetical protein